MAYHMFFGFNLKPGVDTGAGHDALRAFADRLIDLDLLQSMSPIATRHAHPVLDTARDAKQTYFTTMTFRDLEQANTSVTHIYEWTNPTDGLHNTVIDQTTDQIFICFQDPH